MRFGLPDDYWQTYAAKVRAVSLADVDRAAREYLRPDREVFVVVGDRAKIEPALSKLGFARISAINADGDTP